MSTPAPVCVYRGNAQAPTWCALYAGYTQTAKCGPHCPGFIERRQQPKEPQQ